MIAETATTTNDATLVYREDGYHLITEGVAQESAHLSNLREKITKEIWHLEAVYNTMCDHNNYLGSQLDSFAERILPMCEANCESTLFYQRMKECGFHDEKKNLLKLVDYQENMLILRFTRLAFLV
ncbi:hypothetical protein RhiirA5_416436 [Rhizophagus irregularis]|uniref:RasGAP protein C-terminal domain-containing protein n=1 Tax=Rhizophagus irregularis TaxID=588596 RepID=A0A2I1EBS4_9GLOM|nr:hypothetical protein RhiirA5_416436 [Rhizophagus irregularis]PKY19553.1 hypothetical protein RhiirB3_432632 [Rhizophagus irregularis]